MRSKDIRTVIGQMSLDHNARVAGALRKLATNVGKQLQETGTPPSTSPMRLGNNNYGISIKHEAQAVKDSTRADKIAAAHRSIAQQLKSKTEITNMMG